MKFHETQVGLYQPANTAIHINEARDGLDCNCVCLDCGRRLVAVKNFENKSTAPYFRHHNPDNKNPCNFSNASRETALHLALKKQVYEEKRIAAPKVRITRECPYENYKYQDFSIYSGKPLSFDDVLIEKKMGSIIPDCIGIIGEYRVAIEIKVTHGVSVEKLEKIKRAGLDCLEVYAPRQLEKLTVSSIINDSKYIEWLHFGRAYKEKVLQACERWFENEKLRVEAKIESKKKRIADNEIALKPKRIKELAARLMKNWDDEHLRLTPFDHQIYAEFDHDLDDLCSRVPSLNHLSFPYSMKSEVADLSDQLSILSRQQIEPEIECSEARKKLISAFEYQHARCNAGSFEQITPFLDGQVNHNVDDIRIRLKKYLDDMRHLIMERKIEYSKKVWLEKQSRSGLVFDNPDYEFAVSPEYSTSLSIIKIDLDDLGFGAGMTRSFYELIERFLEKKYLFDNPDPSKKIQYNAVFKRYQLLNNRLKNQVKLYIEAIIGPHHFERRELTERVEKLLSPYRVAKECVKELIYIKMETDFNNQVLPHNQRVRVSIEKEILDKVRAMDNETLKRELLLTKEKIYFY